MVVLSKAVVIRNAMLKSITALAWQVMAMGQRATLWHNLLEHMRQDGMGAGGGGHSVRTAIVDGRAAATLRNCPATAFKMARRCDGGALCSCGDCGW